VILIDDKLVSEDILEGEFVCNLGACKGACCVQGEEGAPLEEEELQILEDIYDKVAPYLTEAGRQTIAEKGTWEKAPESAFTGLATPLIDADNACAYVQYDDKGVAQCGIELAHLDGKIKFKKPISCHLYPIRITQQQFYDAVNYNRWEVCSPACTLGKELKVPLYQFLKEPLIRKYGEDFYEQLEGAAKFLDSDEGKEKPEKTIE